MADKRSRSRETLGHPDDTRSSSHVLRIDHTRPEDQPNGLGCRPPKTGRLLRQFMNDIRPSPAIGSDNV